MVTAEELTVAIRSEGVSDTQQDLEGVERTMEDTAESAGESADNLQEFSERFEGAMSAAVAALAIATAGLASQVPVLGEVFAGFGAIVDAVAFKVDGLLRPALSGLTPFLFDVAAAINETDGAMADLVGVLGIVGTAVGSVIAGFTAWAAKTILIAGEVGKVTSALTTAGGAIKSFATSIASFISGSLAAAAALGVLLGTLGVAALEVTGVLDAVTNLGNTIANQLPAWARDGFTALLGSALAPFAALGALILGFVQGTLEGGLVEGVNQAGARLKQVFDTVIDAWSRTFGRLGGLVTGFLDGIVTGIENAVSDVAAAAKSVKNTLVKFLNPFGSRGVNPLKWGRSLIERIVDGIEGVMGTVTDAVKSVKSTVVSFLNPFGSRGVNPFGWGKKIVQQLADGMRAAVGAVKDAAEFVAGEIDKRMPSSPAEEGPLSDLDSAGPGLVETVAGGVEQSAGRAGDAVDSAFASASGRRSGGGVSAMVRLDGRDVSEDTGRYRADPSRRRGL